MSELHIINEELPHGWNRYFFNIRQISEEKNKVSNRLLKAWIKLWSGELSIFNLKQKFHRTCKLPVKLQQASSTVRLRPCLVPNFSPNFTMQKEDSPSYRNIGTCMEY
jgi:hypothetical protein